MRTPWCVLAVFLFALTISVCFADIIHLKNGRKIECTSAWEEGGNIKYVVAGGTILLPKSMVLKVEKTLVKKDEPETSKPSDPEEKSSAAIPKASSEQETRHEPDRKVKLRAVDSYTNAAVDLAEKKDFDGALEKFQKAYQLNKNEDTAFNLAAIHFILKDDWNAERYFNEVVRINPRNAEALYYMGDISWRKEELEEAQAYWQRAYQIHPDPEIKGRLESVGKERKAAEAFEKNASPHFLIRYDGGAADPGLVQEMSEFLEETYQELSNRFETYPSDPFIVVLYPRETFFDVTDMPAWSGGANDGKIKLPVKGLTSISEQMKSVLTHELTHSFVRFKTSDNYPVWLQEGLAQYQEGKRLGMDQSAVLSSLIQRNQLPPIERLSGSFLGASSQVAGVLYVYSLAFTEYLLDQHPSYQMNELLAELGKGIDFVEAFESVYQTPVAEIERQWRSEFVTE